MGEVRLRAITQPVGGIAPDATALLAYFARVSSSANRSNHETGGKLIRSLVRRKEWSPFEMISLTMEIETTRDIARQILRHRSFSFQEFSQRYAAVEHEPTLREARLQHPTDRQMSVETGDTMLHGRWEAEQAKVAVAARTAYQWALDQGIAKEVARAVLPEGMTVSRLFMAGTLRSWMHYVDLRVDPKTQKEHRVIAERCAEILRSTFPALTDLLAAAPPSSKEQE